MSTPKAIGKTYQVGDQIGKGAFGKIFRGLNVKTGEVVAIKQIEKSLVAPSQLEGILKEVDVLPKLAHLNLIKFVESHDMDKFLYFILEFVEGGSLRDAVKNFGTFPESLLVLYLTQVLRGLHYLHEQSIPHRHLKGDNILLTKEGMCKLSNSGTFPYTLQQIKANPFWSAPEVIEGAVHNLRADIWGIGCCIIELLTGSPPYMELGNQAAVTKIVEEASPPIPSTISPDLQDMLKQCFMKDPKKRINSTNLLSHRCLTSIWGTAATTVASSSNSSKTRRRAPTLRLSSLFSSSKNNGNSAPATTSTKQKEKRKGLSDFFSISSSGSSSLPLTSSSTSTSPATSPTTSPFSSDSLSRSSPLRSRSPSVFIKEDPDKRKKMGDEKVLDWLTSIDDDDVRTKKLSVRAPEPRTAPNALKRFSSVSAYNPKVAERSKGSQEMAVSAGYRKTIERLDGLLRTERDVKQQLATSRIQYKNEIDTIIRKIKTVRETTEQQPNLRNQKAILQELDAMLAVLIADAERNTFLLSEMDLLEDSEPLSPSSSKLR